MSRGFILGILAILVALLGVMSMIVKKPAGKHEEEEAPKAQTAAQKPKPAEEMKKEMMQRQKQMMTAMQEAENAKKHPNAPHKPDAPPVNPKTGKPQRVVTPGSMDITHEWYKERKPGEQGVEELHQQLESEKQTAAKQAAAPQPPAHKPHMKVIEDK